MLPSLVADACILFPVCQISCKAYSFSMQWCLVVLGSSQFILSSLFLPHYNKNDMLDGRIACCVCRTFSNCCAGCSSAWHSPLLQRLRSARASSSKQSRCLVLLCLMQGDVRFHCACVWLSRCVAVWSSIFYATLVEMGSQNMDCPRP